MSTQRLAQAVSGTPSSGTVTLAFPPVPQSLVWTGTITVPGSDLGATWTAYIGENVASGQVIGSWLGRAVFGPLQAWGRERVILVGTGLTNGVPLQAIWRGSSGDESEVDPVSPVPFVSSLSVAQLVAGTISGQTIVIGPGGSIQSSDFVVGVSGWRLSDPGGSGEIEAYGTSAVLVAGVIKTAMTGRRVELNNTDFARILFDPGTGQAAGSIYVDSTGYIQITSASAPGLNTPNIQLKPSTQPGGTIFVSGRLQAVGDLLSDGVLENSSLQAVPLATLSGGHTVRFDWDGVNFLVYVDSTLVRTL